MQGDTNVLFILDSSGSMWDRIEGQPKVELAREMLNKTLTDLPVTTRAGLLSYGHRRKGDCSDIELLIPIGEKKNVTIASKAATLVPTGKTPIAGAMQQASKAFKDIDGIKMIVLITDGGEECQGDPCAIARELNEQGLLVRVNVVGLKLGDNQRKDVECIAREGGGRYFDVQDKKAFFAAITEIKNGIIHPPIPARKIVESPLPPEPTKTMVKRQPTGKATMPEVSVPVPLPPTAAKPDDVNLLLVSEGGRIAKAEKAGWENIISGRDRGFIWTWAGQEVVFAFKDNKHATFSRFAIGIPGTLKQNVKDFEILAADDSPDGPYRLLGRFRTRNAFDNKLYQEFAFNKTTAKYLKFRVVSNYGYEIQGWGDTQVFQIKLMGTIE